MKIKFKQFVGYGFLFQISKKKKVKYETCIKLLKNNF